MTSFRDLHLQTLDGETFDASTLHGYDVIVVDVWATWCFHCVENMPAMASFSDRLPDLFPDHKVLYIGICTDIVKTDGTLDESLLATAQKISADAGVHYPQLIADKDFNGSFTDLYVTGYPSIFYLNGDGDIIHSTGALSENGYTLTISNLLDMQGKAK